MRRYCLSILCLLLCLTSIRADIVVTSFRYDQSDATANTRNTERFDQNGDRCALIKIETTQRGFHFDVGTLGVTYSEEQNDQHPGEIWVYVPHSVRRITIQHGQLGVLRGYEFPESIKSACTYIMKLSTGSVETYVHETIQSQYLIFRVTPSDAMVNVTSQHGEETTWPVRDGVARQFVPFGQYQYRISADGYHADAGLIDVRDANNAVTIEVNLRPNFGWLKIDANADLRDAVVYIDGKQSGTIPFFSDRIMSGQHSLRIVKPMYKNYNQDFTITDNKTLTLTPNLVANFAELTLKVGKNAEIWVNGERRAQGQWSGNLEAGEYLIETKLDAHRTMSKKITVTSAMRNQTITLPEPAPIYGSLQIETYPDGATIYVDGKEVGKTPKLINNILIGEHQVKVSASDYQDLTQKVTLREGQIAKVEGEQTARKQSVQQSKQQVVKPVPQGKTMETMLVGEFAYAVTPQMAYGLMLGQTYHGAGWYIQGRSNFKSYKKLYQQTTDWAGAELTCDENGKYQGTLLHYSGKTYSSEWLATAGFVGDFVDWGHSQHHRLTTFGMYLGAGYGVREMYWETNYDMGNGQQAIVKYAPTSVRGFAMDLGFLGSFRGFTYKLGISTIKFKYTELEVGIGAMF